MGASEGVSADFRLLYEEGVVKIAGGTIRNIDNVGYLEGSDFDDLLVPIDTAYPSGPDVYGRGGNDHLIADYYSGWGGSGLWGGDGDDEIDATGAQYGPKVYGEDGNDVLRLRSAVSELADGGAGDDTIIGGAYVYGGDGNDVITMQYSNYGGQAGGDAGDDLISAATSGNTIDGGAGGDTLTGNIATDHLRGGADNDVIDGGGGDDVLTGGLGRDALTGGAGADTFLFENGDLSPRADPADRIRDFSQADHDAINLATVDADPSTDRIERFTFVGTAAFSGAVGELRYGFVDGATLVEGDTNGDGAGDVFLRLDGEVALTTKDFDLSHSIDPVGMPGAAPSSVHAHPFDVAAGGVVLA